MEMPMYLTAKQILHLALPFLFTLMIYFFDDSIVAKIRYFFPTYSEYTNKTLDKKAEIYLQIESKEKVYKEIREKMALRPQSTDWIVSKVLYKKLKREDRQEVAPKVENKKVRPPVWRLEAVFAKEKVAIINGKFVSIGSMIDQAQVVEIKKETVCIEFGKERRCLHLFH